jgi:hypothetical protein
MGRKKSKKNTGREKDGVGGWMDKLGTSSTRVISREIGSIGFDCPCQYIRS